MVKALKKITTFMLMLSLVSSWAYGLVPGIEELSPRIPVAEASNKKIRQEINILDGYLGAPASTYATSSAIINIDPSKYTGAAYYFEVVASTSASIDSNVYLKTTAGATVATIAIPSGTTAYSRLRSPAFALVSGSLTAQGVGDAWSLYGISVNSSNNNVYVARYGTDIYKQTGGTGSYGALSAGALNWQDVTVNSSTGDVYAVVYGGDIYKQTSGAGSFVAQSAGNLNWTSIAVNSSTGDVYASVYSGDIYKQTGGSGSFVAQGAGSKNWEGIAVNSSNGDVYATVDYDGLYKQTGGSGSFTRTTQVIGTWRGVAVNSSTNDVYAIYTNGIYKQTAGTGSFVSIGVSRAWIDVTVDPSTGDVYATCGEVYKSTGANDYVVVIGNEAGATKGVSAARVVVLQDAATLSKTQTQIEIGSATTTANNTSTLPLQYPKYWYYDSVRWDGSPAFYAEVTYRDYQVSSSTIFKTSTTSDTTFSVPTAAGISYLIVEAWGAGGGGSIGNAGGGGGGGGAYAKSVFATSSGSTNILVVPKGGVTNTRASAGDATFNYYSSCPVDKCVVADGGTGEAGNGAGVGGNTTNSIGQIEYAGGDGGIGHTTGDVGGGGGGAGGPNGAGVTASGATASTPSAGGAGNTGGENGGAGGAAGTGDGASCPTSAGKAGVNHVNGGGGGGGADGNGSVTCTGGAGGYPGGGGGSSELAGATQAGGPGQIKLTETHGRVNIALEECDYAFSSCAFKQMIVVQGDATSTPTRVRSSAFTPTPGKNYRLVASTTNSGASYDIYNAKIIVDQASPTKLEPQYLLANSMVNAAGLSSFYTLASSTEWANTANTYVHQIDSSADASDSAKLQSNPAGGGTDIADSTATGANRATSTASGFAMPTGTEAERTISTNVLNVPIYASRILVQVAPNTPPTVAPNTADAYDFGTDSTPTLEFTGTDPNTDDVRYNVQIDTSNNFDSLPAGFDLKYVDAHLAKISNPTDNISVEIHSTSPTGTLLGTSDTLSGTAVVDAQYNRFTFSTPVSLSGNTQYYLVMKRSVPDSTNFVAWSRSSTSVYSGGSVYAKTSSVWSEVSNQDFRFKIFDSNETEIITQDTSGGAKELRGEGYSYEELAQSFTVSIPGGIPLMDKTSGTDDGFANTVIHDPVDTDPFVSGEKASFTVQAGDALAENTYYWRVRATDPNASGTYGSWTAARSFTVTSAGIEISGKAYGSEGGAALDSKSIKLYKNGSTLLGTATTNGTGDWSITGSISSGNIVTAFIDGDAVDANTVYVSDGTAKTDVNLYGGTLVVRNDTGTGITNANLQTGAVYGEDDIVYSTTTSNGIILNSTNNLYIPSGSTYGLTASTTLIGGDMHNLGAISGTGNINVIGGEVTGNGAINMTGGTFLLDGTGLFGGNTNWTFNMLTFGDGTGVATTTSTGTGTVTSATTTIAANQILDAGVDKTWNLTASHEPFQLSGTLLASTSSFVYQGTANATVTPATYYNLEISPSSGSPTYLFINGSGYTIANNFNISGAGNVTVDVNTKDPAINIAGNLSIGSGDTLSASNSGTLSVGKDFTNDGTFTHNNGTVSLNTSETGVVSSAANISFYNLSATTPGKVIRFSKHTANVPTFSFDNLFTITGLNGNPIYIESDTPGSQWLADFNAAQTAITYANVRDGACAVGSLSVAFSATNSGRGNNGNCWSFQNRGADGSATVNSVEQGSGKGALREGGGGAGGNGPVEGTTGGGGTTQEGGGAGGGGGGGGTGGAVEGAWTANLGYLDVLLEELEDSLAEMREVINR